MPFDLVKVAVSVTVAFIAVSLYFTVTDQGLLVQPPLGTLGVLVIVLAPLAYLFSYSKAFSGETTLGYWAYIKTELIFHTALTLYILAIGALTWSSLNSRSRYLYTGFFLLTALFYTTTALDIQKLLKKLRIKIEINPLTIARYTVNYVSGFAIIYFLVLLTRGTTTDLDTTLAKYSFFPLLLIGAFFTIYITNLRKTHKGFEELMQRSSITTISYFSALFVFITLYLIYLQNIAQGINDQYPLYGLVFIGYFTVLLAEAYSAKTLELGEYEPKQDIVELLNHVSSHFLKTEPLERLWDRISDHYKYLDPNVERVRFYAPNRSYDFSMTNEASRNAASVAMVLELDRMVKEEKELAVTYQVDVRSEIKNILGKNITTLPEDLQKKLEFKADYPKLLEQTFNNINNAIRPFVSFEDYGSVLKRLVSVDNFFNNLSWNGEIVDLKKGQKIDRKGFLKYLKIYIEALGQSFPFNRMLLRETVKTEIETKLINYGLNQAEILNIVSTGIKEIDEALYGGLLKGTSTLLLSEERRAKNDILFRFISEGLSEKDPSLFTTSRIASKSLLNIFKRFVPIQNLQIIDLYLATHTENVVHIPVEKDNTKTISTSLIQVKQSVVEWVKTHPKETHKRVVLDIYSDLARYQSLPELHELIIKQAEGLGRWNCTTIFTLSPELTSDEVELHFDNVLELSEVAKIKVKKLFGGKPKKESFIIWGSYSPLEDPEYSLYYEIPG